VGLPRKTVALIESRHTCNLSTLAMLKPVVKKIEAVITTEDGEELRVAAGRMRSALTRCMATHVSRIGNGKGRAAPERCGSLFIGGGMSDKSVIRMNAIDLVDEFVVAAIMYDHVVNSTRGQCGVQVERQCYWPRRRMELREELLRRLGSGWSDQPRAGLT
jgi:hypothetical protein